MAAAVSDKMVDAAPVSAPPISQSMDSRNSSGLFSSGSPSGSPAPETPDPSSSSTPSPLRQFDLQNHPPTREEEYRQLFRLPPDEVLIQDFNCALQENFILQGHMYIFVHYICFYSNLFGFETKKIIPFPEITSLRRAKAVAIFPTAIEIIAGGKKYFFTSFLFRDEAFKLINEGWLHYTNGATEITDQQEPKSDTCSQENGNYIVEESGRVEEAVSSRQSLDELDIVESDKKAFALEESKHFADGEPEIVSTSSPMGVREEVNAVAAPVVESSTSGKCSSWEPEDVDAPGVPEGYTKVAESKFPIRVEEFFNLFFSDGSVSFHESYHKKCGDKDFKCTEWRPHEIYGHSREVSFQHPIKIYFGARFGSCHEVQKYRVYRNCHLVIDISQDISDVPYADYFSVQGRWVVKPEGSDNSKPGCILSVYTNVAFSKRTMWKGKIVQSTIEECREVSAIWIDLAHEVLKQKNLEKDEGTSNLISNKQVQPENLANTQQFVDTMANDVRISQILPDAMNINRQVNGNVGEASVGYLLRDTLAKFFASLRHLSTPSLLLVIMVAVIIVLMQISIIVLLSRPQRIHVIPQAGFMHGMNENGAEVLDSVNRQMKYLKEEMHFVETLLEKMRYDHSQLKAKLMELELFRNQQV